MKQIYKASDGKIFENKKECRVHEFNLRGGEEGFRSIVREAANIFENKTGLKVNINEAKASIGWDGDPNTDKLNYVEWQIINLTVYEGDVQRGENYSRGSEGHFTRDSIIEELMREYHYPYLKIHEGIVTDSENGAWYAEGYSIGEIDINEILRANYGKKIRIEVLE